MVISILVEEGVPTLGVCPLLGKQNRLNGSYGIDRSYFKSWKYGSNGSVRDSAEKPMFPRSPFLEHEKKGIETPGLLPHWRSSARILHRFREFVRDHLPAIRAIALMMPTPAAWATAAARCLVRWRGDLWVGIAGR